MTIEQRIAGLDWSRVGDHLDHKGFAVLPSLISAAECGRLASHYDGPPDTFRSKVIMARHSFGSGEYKYFAYPLPPLVADLRSAFYAPLATIANGWAAKFSERKIWPRTLDKLTRACRDEGQNRPTPLLLKYRKGDYNCLHQDLYGAIQFPLQVIVLLSRTAEDFEGGELVLVEQRPRQQSRPIVVPLEVGGAAVIPVRYRPAMGARGWRRLQMRHGVSEVTAGQRMTLGLIFHDAA